MTPSELTTRLERLRRSLRALGFGAIATWAIGALGVVLAAGVLTRAIAGAPSAMVMWTSCLLLATAVAWWRWRTTRPDRVRRLDAALWAEQQAPDLRYALVTLAEREHPTDADPVQQRLAAYTGHAAWEPAVMTALRRRRVRVFARLAATVMLFAIAAYPWPPRRLTAGTLPGIAAILGKVGCPERYVSKFSFHEVIHHRLLVCDVIESQCVSKFVREDFTKDEVVVVLIDIDAVTLIITLGEFTPGVEFRIKLHDISVVV